jgi:hypothetical protein
MTEPAGLSSVGPSAKVLQLAADHDIEPEAGG